MDVIYQVFFVLISIISTVIIVILIFVIWPFIRPHPQSGTVIEKSYEPHKEKWLSFVPLFAIGKLTIKKPHLNFDNEEWVITIEGQNGQKGKVYLKETTWQKIKIGDSFLGINEQNEHDDRELDDQAPY